MIERIPITLLTGFLGSGKTTLLKRMLESAAFADTAVLINELGAAGLDQHLVRGASETMRVLENGCVCCTVRDDLASVLGELFWDRLHRRVPRFRQVVIETTGLADPGPLLRVVEDRGIVAERYRWSRILCTVDAVHGTSTLHWRPEALRQVALADVLFITKTDLASSGTIDEVAAQLATINPAAIHHRIAHGQAPADVWTAATSATKDRAALMPRAPETPTARPRALHANDVHTFTVDVPCASRESFASALRALGRGHADALLRVKGLVHVSDDDRLQVVQMVRDELYPLHPLDSIRDAAPSALVFIVHAPSEAMARSIEKSIRSGMDGALAR